MDRRPNTERLTRRFSIFIHIANISFKINSNPDLYKVAYYNSQKKITNIPPPPSTSISNTKTSAFAPPNSNYPQPNPVKILHQ
ncbi:BgTH12-03379 [Blumeria graminis f. sp. triticale]|uniref:BgTH12-03379 n=1 Tax=Blumeria graminis f. sp. triticale TaxID=1689686 RepID=A0A9W4GG99_BLUGR|nr:BgTH12-03379 [Blumeria graminis f. sp. triticale]